MVKLLHFQRSAIEPVGIVATVSINATMYKNNPRSAGVMVPVDIAQPPWYKNTQLPLPMSGSPTGSVRPIPAKLNPPKASGKPTRKNATKPNAKIAKLVLTTCAACFARVNPVSTSANPACMKMTSIAPMTTHNRLSCVPRISTSDCIAAFFLCTNSNETRNVGDPNLSVTDLSCGCG